MTEQQKVFVAASHLNYNADVRHMVGEVVGPNLFGERFRAVSADYDEATGRTRVGFELLRADESGAGA